MKKVILALVFALGMTTSIKASSDVQLCTVAEAELADCCACDAWNYGSLFWVVTGGDPYAGTEWYYATFCE